MSAPTPTGPDHTEKRSLDMIHTAYYRLPQPPMLIARLDGGHVATWPTLSTMDFAYALESSGFTSYTIEVA